MGYRLSFYIKMSVLLTGASWRADLVVRQERWWVQRYVRNAYPETWGNDPI